MFDARITEIATGQVKNYFDIDNEWVRMMKSALHPDLFTIMIWPVLKDYTGFVGDPIDVYADNARDYNEGCYACTDSERYDDHIHEDSTTANAMTRHQLAAIYNRGA